MYLYIIRYLAIQYTVIQQPSDDIQQQPSTKELLISSDATFADDKKTRKSTQSSFFSLFGGPIGWEATKQHTITISSTEAELLALSSTAKTTISVTRLMEQLGLKLDHKVTIECDNLQAIRLVTTTMPRINTALKHVDIHNSWLRQAY
ncbi:uncharacterized protein UV8b_06771 [Ustilaginoidea virens]|uniref:Polyprotein n=1 Tax=Ustilaginoidea virens TaxID=1159556 RepID=A0A8E5HW79_USTVR|nr:uncharacterized protein UV8b_06771 [Ustilaginoidea virens]QUC22530.1 hypothetical protein UV8b_06771 [Ustilaginoidea virens]